jgi:hypothetical protein
MRGNAGIVAGPRGSRALSMSVGRSFAQRIEKGRGDPGRERIENILEIVKGLF